MNAIELRARCWQCLAALILVAGSSFFPMPASSGGLSTVAAAWAQADEDDEGSDEDEDEEEEEPGFCTEPTESILPNDVDDDGLSGEDDCCPRDPDKDAAYDCGCGVSDDADGDEDGVADCVDECPADPFKFEPEVCGCGVEDLDDNENLVIDCLEQAAGSSVPVFSAKIKKKTSTVVADCNFAGRAYDDTVQFSFSVKNTKSGKETTKTSKKKSKTSLKIKKPGTYTARCVATLLDEDGNPSNIEAASEEVTFKIKKKKKPKK